jgi:formate-dependent nitrite reductase membrane component NrfD
MEKHRQWITTHEWMVKPTAQTEWVDGQGLLIWLAEVFSALGMGLYLVALFLNNWWGQLAGYFIIVGLKLPFHFFYLGRPWRFWRAIPPFTNAWKTSWMARGMFFSIMYSGFALIQLITTYQLEHHLVGVSSIGAVTALDWVMRLLAGFFMFLTGIYCGFMMSYCKSVPFWNTGMLPIVFVIMGLADGLGLIMGIGLITGGVDFHSIEAASRIFLLVNTMLIGTYLINASYQSITAEYSVKQLIVGRVAMVFWLGVIILGIVVPAVISIISLYAAELSPPLLVIAIVSHTIGAFSLKYCVLKVGIYRPILSRVPVY